MATPASVKTLDATAADDILAEVNAQNWGQAFNATRNHRAPLNLNDVKVMHVLIQANGSRSQQYTRGTTLWTHEITLTFRKAIDVKQVGAADQLNRFAEKFRDFYRKPRGVHKIGSTDKVVVSAVLTPVNPDEIETNSTFICTLDLLVNELQANV